MDNLAHFFAPRVHHHSNYDLVELVNKLFAFAAGVDIYTLVALKVIYLRETARRKVLVLYLKILGSLIPM